MLVPPLLAFHLAMPSFQAPPDPAALIEAERAFARDAAEKGTRAGFLAHMGDGSVVFEPLPVDARATWEAREARPGVLAWQPEHAQISASGDVGWTTGPWEFRPRSGADEPVAFGEYATVWRKTSSGAWKWAADIGIGHGRPAGPAAEPTLAPVGGPAAATTPADVLAAERAFVSAAGAGIEAAYLEHAAPGVLLLREGAARAEGVDAATALAARHPVSWEPIEAFVSEAGDLGWVYGLTLLAGEPDSAGYLRVWNRLPGGDWKIALDVANASPP
jgi:ketosteroid isomerase-like protein